MVILQFINSLCSGGGERFVVDLSNELERQGNEVHVVTYGGSEERLYFNKQFLSSTIKIHTLEIPMKFTMKGIARFEDILNEIKPDIVNAHLNVLPYIYKAALMHKDIKFFITQHTLAQNLASKFQKPIDRWFYKKNIIRPVTISEECQKSYETYYNLQNATTIVNGRSEPRKSEDFGKVRSQIESLKKNANTPVFINVARFHPAKNHAMLIDAFNKLNDEDIDFILLVIGNHFDDNEEGIQLQKKACGKIHFLGEKSNVSDYLLNTDYFCLSSLYEGLPISLLEALSCKVMPICTPVGGIPNVITDGLTGYISKDLSSNSYVETIKRALESDVDKNSLYELYDKKYSMKKCASEYLKLYQS